MALSGRTDKRHPIPRWQGFLDTTRSGELSKPRKGGAVLDSGLTAQVKHWKKNPSLRIANEILQKGLIHRDFERLQPVANFILQAGENTSSLTVEICKRIVASDSFLLADELALPERVSDIWLYAKLKLRELRAILRRTPDNVIVIVEAARWHCVLGNYEKSNHLLEMALRCNPDNRFVVRAAIRFQFDHYFDVHSRSKNGENVEQGLRILRRADKVNDDPWLLSAGVALQGIKSKRSRYYSQGQKLIESLPADPDFQVCELLASVGTVDLRRDQLKKGLEKFEMLLQCPNGNSIAQAEWVNRNYDGLEMQDVTALDNEANASELLHHNNLVEAESAGSKWILENPTSDTPILFSSFVLGEQGNWSDAVKLCEESIRYNSGSFGIRNNLAYYSALQGDVGKARKALDSINPRLLRRKDLLVFIATLGLVEYADGNEELGKQCYLRAAEAARSSGDRKLVSRIKFHHSQSRWYCEVDELTLGEFKQRMRDEHASLLGNELENMLANMISIERDKPMSIHPLGSSGDSTIRGISKLIGE